MPQTLQDLISRSARVHARILKLDKMILNATMPNTQTANPIGNQMARLAQAYGQSE